MPGFPILSGCFKPGLQGAKRIVPRPGSLTDETVFVGDHVKLPLSAALGFFAVPYVFFDVWNQSVSETKPSQGLAIEAFVHVYDNPFERNSGPYTPTNKLFELAEDGK